MTTCSHPISKAKTRNRNMVDQYGNPWPRYRLYPPRALSPLRAVRHKCLDCCCESSQEVEACPVRDCPLWIYRFGSYPADHKGRRSVLKPIKEKCRDCTPEPRHAVRNCLKKCCPLYPYRLGTNPRRKGQSSAEIARLGGKPPAQKHESGGNISMKGKPQGWQNADQNLSCGGPSVLGDSSD